MEGKRENFQEPPPFPSLSASVPRGMDRHIFPRRRNAAEKKCVERCVARKCENATYVTMTLKAHYLEERVKTLPMAGLLPPVENKIVPSPTRENRDIIGGKYFCFRTFSPSETCFFPPRPFFFQAASAFSKSRRLRFHSDVMHPAAEATSQIAP